MSEGDAPLLGYRSNQPPVPPSAVCPKCGSRMAQGVAFAVGGGTQRARTLWVAGLARRSWLGTVVIPKGKWYEIIAYRCPGCGFVEHYCPPG